MKYRLDGLEYLSAEECARDIIDNLGDQVYDEMLDDCYGEIEICGYSWAASIALYRVDPIAYRCGRDDYYDSLYPDIVDGLERMTDGDEETFYGFDVEAMDDEEDTGNGEYI